MHVLGYWSFLFFALIDFPISPCLLLCIKSSFTLCLSREHELSYTLTNNIRHPHALTLSVSLTLSGKTLTLSVTQTHAYTTLSQTLSRPHSPSLSLTHFRNHISATYSSQEMQTLKNSSIFSQLQEPHTILILRTV